MKYKWLLFDADNTIYDFHASSEIAFHKAFEHHNIQSQDEWYQKFREINYTTWKAFDENLLSHEEIKRIRFTQLFEEIELEGLDPLEFNSLYFKKLVENPKYMPGAKELLDDLKGKVKLGLITNGMKEVQRPRLMSSGMMPYFDVVVISGEIGHSKPNKAFFDYVYERMDAVPRHEVLVVGDNIVADIKGSIDYGFDAVWYNAFGLEDQGIESKQTIKNLDDLNKLLY